MKQEVNNMPAYSWTQPVKLLRRGGRTRGAGATVEVRGFAGAPIGPLSSKWFNLRNPDFIASQGTTALRRRFINAKISMEDDAPWIEFVSFGI